MTMHMLTHAKALSNADLLARLPQLAANERTATAELVAHLVALDMRPDVYASQGYGSLFGYCTGALRLSEDAACTRIAAVSACRRFPQVLDMLVSGTLTLTAVRRIGPHLNAENCEWVLARASNRSRSDVEALLAELAPRPDVVPSVRKLPVRGQVAADTPPVLLVASANASPSFGETAAAPSSQGRAAPAAPPGRRPQVQPSAPERFRVQFTVGPEAHDKLRRVQALLRREIPSGDVGMIFERALDLLVQKVERAKVGKATRPRATIRSETDGNDWAAVRADRYIPNEVKRVVWERDAGRCAFVSAAGHRCTETTYLEFHHLIPFATGGRATVGNIALRCRRHNQYEARLVFGPRGESRARETPGRYTTGHGGEGSGETLPRTRPSPPPWPGRRWG
jgi:hypothetical protein